MKMAACALFAMSISRITPGWSIVLILMLLFAYLVPCLSTIETTNSLVTKPFKKWARYTSVIVEHAEKTYHRDAMIAAQAFKESVENPSNIVACLFDKEREKRMKKKPSNCQIHCKSSSVPWAPMHSLAWSQGEAWSIREPGQFFCFTQSFFRGRSNFGNTFTDWDC